MPPLAGRRGTKRSLWKRAAAGLDELELSWSRGSRCEANTSVRSPLPHSHGWRGTRCRRRAAWKEGDKGYPNDQIRCGGGTRSGTQTIAASEDFASFLIYVSVRRSFPHWGFSVFCTVWYMCTCSIFGCCRGCCRMRCCSGLPVPLETSSFEDSVYCRSAAIIPVSNGSAWGSLSLVMRESQQWVRFAPERLKLP